MVLLQLHVAVPAEPVKIYHYCFLSVFPQWYISVFPCWVSPSWFRLDDASSFSSYYLYLLVCWDKHISTDTRQFSPLFLFFSWRLIWHIMIHDHTALLLHGEHTSRQTGWAGKRNRYYYWRWCARPFEKAAVWRVASFFNILHGIVLTGLSLYLFRLRGLFRNLSVAKKKSFVLFGCNWLAAVLQIFFFAGEGQIF
jgi:hypothetical protein